MVRPPFWRPRIAGVIVLFVATACGFENIQPSPAPTPPTLPASYTVTGTVWVHQPGGVVKAQSGAVSGWVERPTRADVTPSVPIGPDGRYSIVVPNDTVRVRVRRGQFQPCAVTVTSFSQPADLHIVSDLSQLGANVPAELMSNAPTLSGVVYENTPEGRRPVRGASVVLDALFGQGLVVADTLTDAEGRYALCAVPFLPKLVLQADATGFELAEVSERDLTGRTTIDVEMKRLPR